jgi:alpha-beta hydrolase superfamily lysophospholipase
VLILHGLAEHCGRYGHIATFFTERGFAVRTFDHRGHGQSSGARGDCPDSMSLVNDAEIIIRDFAKHCQTQPLLFGHSMGGLFAARIATSATVPLRGLILSSPALALWLTPVHRILIKLLSVLAPHFAIKVRFNPEYLSHELATVVGYLSDPLVHQRLTASLVNSILAAIDFIKSHASTITIPTLLLVAQQDHVINPQGSHDFFNALPDKLRTAHFYADDYHEIFNESDTARVLGDLHNWLTEQQFIS